MYMYMYIDMLYIHHTTERERLTALREEIDDGVDLTAPIEILELCGAVESEIVNTQSPFSPVGSVE